MEIEVELKVAVTICLSEYASATTLCNVSRSLIQMFCPVMVNPVLTNL